MPQREHAYKASQILSIGAIVKQLEAWDKTQEIFAVRRAAANVYATGGRAQRILDAHHRAQVALGTQHIQDPL
jgi:succinate dehydrogenase/fumarate reductase flavoprotein subunit